MRPDRVNPISPSSQLAEQAEERPHAFASSETVDHAARLLTSGDQFVEALRLWSLNQKAVWQISAMFARFCNDFSDGIAVFASAGFDVVELACVPSSLRVVLEELLADEGSPARLKAFTPAIDAIVQRYLISLRSIRSSGIAGSATSRIADRTQSLPLNRLSVSSCLDSFLREFADFKEALESWNTGEISDVELFTHYRLLNDNFDRLSLAFAQHTVDVKDLSTCMNDLNDAMTSRVAKKAEPDSVVDADDTFKNIFIRLLTGLQGKQAEYRQGRATVQRRATFRQRAAVFEPSDDSGPRLPSSRSRELLGMRRAVTK